MQTFFNVLSMAEASKLLSNLARLESERVDLENIEYGILAEDVTAKENLPFNSRSSMDGYAVMAADTFGSSENNPSFLDLVYDCPVNNKERFCLKNTKCASIVTGSPIPDNCDAVMMHEYTQKLSSNLVEIHKSVAPGENIMLEGEDYKLGDLVLTKGQKLRPQELGLLAALGENKVSIYKKAQVAILSTGDEVINPNQKLEYGQVRDVNSYTLQAIVRKTGAKSKLYGIVPDNLDQLEKMIKTMLSDKADLILLSGGSSVGMRDLTIQALSSIQGMEILCHGLAINPGKPVIIAKIGQTVIFGLPGQVSSSQIVMQMLTVPFIWHIQGLSEAFDPKHFIKIPATLSRNIASKPGREDYVRVKLIYNEQKQAQAVPILALSGLMKSLIEADGLIKIPASLEGLEANSLVEVIII